MCTSYYVYLSSLNIYREYSKHNQSKQRVTWHDHGLEYHGTVCHSNDKFIYFVLDTSRIWALKIWFGKKKSIGFPVKVDPISDPKVQIFSLLQMRAEEPL